MPLPDAQRTRRSLMIVVRILLVVIAAETLLMHLLPLDTHPRLAVLADGPLAALLVIPFLYYWVFREMRMRDEAEASLQRATQELELRVQERLAELREAYGELSRREQELSTLAAHSPDFITRTSPDMRILYASPSMERVTGRPARDLVGRTRQEVGLLSAGALRVEAEVRRVFETGKEVRFEFAHPTHEGERCFDAIARPEKTADGTPVSVLLISRDITERKRAEQEVRLLQAVTQTIAEASDYPKALEGMLRTICLATGWEVGEVWVPSADRSRLEFGSAWSSQDSAVDDFIRMSRRMTFARGEGIPGISWERRATVCFPQIVEDHEFLRREAAEKAGLRAVLGVPVFAGDELVMVMDFLVSRVMDWGREPWVGIVKTAAVQIGSFILRKQAEEERERLRLEFLEAQKLEAIGRLAGGVAHDFSNILSAVIGTSELMLSELKPSDRRYADLSVIRDSSLHGVALIKQLLALSRGKTGGFEPCDMNAILSGLEGMLRRVLGEDIQLELRLSSGLWNVSSEKGHLEQVVMNLAVNARDAMPQGGRLVIETSNRPLHGPAASEAGLAAGDYAALRVSDTGVGMAPDVQRKIFEPFFTTKPAGTGTGLGLATVHHVVRRSGGGVAVESAVGRGTSFTLFFPRARAQAAEPRPRPKPAPGDWRRGTETILLVEDDAVVRAVARQILRKAGYTVLAAENAEEAVALAREHRGEVKLLLTDVQLPEMDGFSLARTMADMEPGLSVAFVSGHRDRALVAQARALSPTAGFIPKPFTMESLLKAVRRVLG